MKKILALGLLLTGISFATIAQETTKKDKTGRRGHDKKEMIQKTPEEMAQMRTDRLDKEVKLTEQQRKDVYALNLEHAKAKKQAIDARKKDMQVRQDARKASQEQLNKILTPEQQKLMAEKMSKDEGKKSHRREGYKKDFKGGNRSEGNKVKSSTGGTSKS